MNTLLTLNQQTLYNLTTNKLTCDQTTLLLHSTKLSTFPHCKTTWRLHAQSKGFGNTPNNKPMPRKENASKPSLSKQEQEDEEDMIPQVVFDRMLKRILFSVGLPMVIGVVLLKLIDFLKEKQIWDVPLWVPFLTTFVFFGSSVLGVAYGSLSTSWDSENGGSILGFDEAKENWKEMWKEEDDNKKSRSKDS